MTSSSATQSNRDVLVRKLMKERTKVGLTDTVNKTVEVGLITGLIKRVISGESANDIVQWLNKGRRRSGKDVWQVYDLVWNKFKEDIYAMDEEGN